MATILTARRSPEVLDVAWQQRRRRLGVEVARLDLHHVQRVRLQWRHRDVSRERFLHRATQTQHEQLNKTRPQMFILPSTPHHICLTSASRRTWTIRLPYWRFLHLFRKRTFKVLYRPGCYSCYPTSGIEVLKGKKYKAQPPSPKAKCFMAVVTLPTRGVQSIAICMPVCQSVSVHVCLFVCLYVCPLAYIKNHISKLHEIFCTCYLSQWLDPSLTTTQYVLYKHKPQVHYA